MWQANALQSLRYFREQLFPLVSDAVLTQLCQASRTACIEIPFRHVRISIDLPAQKTPYIPPVFKHWRVRRILRMPLKEHKQTLVLLDKHVHARIGRTREHGISMRLEIFFPQPIPSGVRNLESRRNPIRQGMIGKALTIENSEVLLFASDSTDTILIEYRSVGSQTRPYRGIGVIARPLQNLPEALPIWFVCQVGRQGFSTRDNEAIQIGTKQAFRA